MSFKKSRTESGNFTNLNHTSTRRESKREQISKRSKISGQELNDAMRFLTSHPVGTRIRAAEYALTLLIKNKLPRMRQCIFNAVFELKLDESKAINGRKRSLITKGEINRSKSSSGYIKVNFKEHRIQFSLSYRRDITEIDALLYARSLGEVLAVTYAALGLDMTGFSRSYEAR